MSLLAAGVISCLLGGVYLLANGHWWAIAPLVVLGSVAWGTWRLFFLHDEPPI